jgi:hypothetical protein
MIDFTSPGFPGCLYRSSPTGAGGVSGSHPSTNGGSTPSLSCPEPRSSTSEEAPRMVQPTQGPPSRSYSGIPKAGWVVT